LDDNNTLGKVSLFFLNLILFQWSAKKSSMPRLFDWTVMINQIGNDLMMSYQKNSNLPVSKWFTLAR
jgi:hypothetical protein